MPFIILLNEANALPKGPSPPKSALSGANNFVSPFPVSALRNLNSIANCLKKVTNVIMGAAIAAIMIPRPILPFSFTDSKKDLYKLLIPLAICSSKIVCFTSLAWFSRAISVAVAPVSASGVLSTKRSSFLFAFFNSLTVSSKDFPSSTAIILYPSHQNRHKDQTMLHQRQL